jgi:hypothetical protein
MGQLNATAVQPPTVVAEGAESAGWHAAPSAHPSHPTHPSAARAAAAQAAAAPRQPAAGQHRLVRGETDEESKRDDPHDHEKEPQEVLDGVVRLAVAAQVAFGKHILKPGFHVIGSRVETRRLSSYGSTDCYLYSPTSRKWRIHTKWFATSIPSEPRRSGTKLTHLKLQTLKNQVFHVIGSRGLITRRLSSAMGQLGSNGSTVQPPTEELDGRHLHEREALEQGVVSQRAAVQVDPFVKANFETRFSLYSAQGLKPGGFKL